MGLTEATIRECSSDEDLFRALSDELQWRMPPEPDLDLDGLVDKIRALPRGLRAMAAIFQLDVSVTLDDLGWHFGNWHHRPYCDETLLGLRELEAHEAAEIFSSAYSLVQPYWDTIGQLLDRGSGHFTEWYSDSDLEKALMPLNQRMWDLCEAMKDFGLMTYWLTYARRYPQRVLLAE